MLAELLIENFAIIDRLHIRFAPGFTVLTGETGAGKSIIIDALQAALGARTGSDVIRGDARLAAIEAIFEMDAESGPDDRLNRILDDYGIEDDNVLILRREIAATGRSTARINGRAAPMSALMAVGDLLVDIHGQSDHLSILRRDRQLDVLDRYGGLLSLRKEVADSIRAYAQLKQTLRDLVENQREAEQRLDLLKFQVGELEGADVRPREEEELVAERNVLVNAERLAQAAARAYEALYVESGSGIEAVQQSALALRDVAGVDQNLSPLAERLEAAAFELEDIAQELRKYRDLMEFDPDRLSEVEERLDVLSRLKRKYGPTLEDVVAYLEQARREIDQVENIEERIAQLESDVAAAEMSAASGAEHLSGERQTVARSLQDAMRDALQGLGMKSTEFEVKISQQPSADGLVMPGRRERFAFTYAGVDSAYFLVSFNVGEGLRPLEKVASGGETSRFLLALKSVLAEADQTETLVFDEVDVGVGGRAATNVGQRMADLARSHQVLSITHLPQIAALADHHLTASKVESGQRTSVNVQVLDRADRIVEIAQMMTGGDTEAARHNAAELLEAAQHQR